jgi:hypothetical protein
MNEITLSKEWFVVVAEDSNGDWDALLWGPASTEESVAEGTGKSQDAAIAHLYAQFTDSAEKMPAGVLLEFRTLYLQSVDALVTKSSKRCGIGVVK